jgi:hypothetical protein
MTSLRISALGVILGALAANASASFGWDGSSCIFAGYVGDSPVALTYISGGDFNDGFAPKASDGAYNRFYGSGYLTTYSSYVYAENGSYSASNGTGSASQFNGFEYLLSYTNVTAATEYFALGEYIDQENQVEGDGATLSSAGFEEIGGSNAYGYNTFIMDESGIPYFRSDNFAIVFLSYYNSFADCQSEGGFGEYLAPGQSVMVKVWASGYSAVNTVPSPIAGLGYGLGLLARRRNKSTRR